MERYVTESICHRLERQAAITSAGGGWLKARYIYPSCVHLDGLSPPVSCPSQCSTSHQPSNHNTLNPLFCSTTTNHITTCLPVTATLAPAPATATAVAADPASTKHLPVILQSYPDHDLDYGKHRLRNDYTVRAGEAVTRQARRADVSDLFASHYAFWLVTDCYDRYGGNKNALLAFESNLL